MVTAVDTPLSSREENRADCKNESFFYDTACQIKKYIKLCSVPFKRASLMFSWGEVIPLSSSWLVFFAEKERAIKAISKTFHVPKFFIKQINLCHSIEQITNSSSAYLRKKSEDIKNFVFSLTAATVASLKAALMLNKAKYIDLNKISRLLPAYMGQVASVMEFVLFAAKSVDRTGKLMFYLQSDRAYDKTGALKTKAIQATKHWASGILKFTSSAVAAASNLFGFYLPPVIYLFVSTLIFGLYQSLMISAYREHHELSHRKNYFESMHALPA